MGLKVFDLRCEHGHVFEGWFRSDDNYEQQQARGLLSCPLCSSTEITKQLSAPRLNISHLRAERLATPDAAEAESVRQAARAARAAQHEGAADERGGSSQSGAQSDSAESAAHDRQPVAAPSDQAIAQLQAHFLKQLRQAVNSADDVGNDFAAEARRMHSGESQERSIRGVATNDELEALHDEGIDVLPIPGFLDDDHLH